MKYVETLKHLDTERAREGTGQGCQRAGRPSLRDRRKKSSGPRFFDKKSASSAARAVSHTARTKNGLTLGSTIYNYTSLSLHSAVYDTLYYRLQATSGDLNHRGTGSGSGVLGADVDVGQRKLAGCEQVVTPEDHGSCLRGPKMRNRKRDRWRSWRLWGGVAHLVLVVGRAERGGRGVLKVVVVKLFGAPGVDGVLARLCYLLL